VRQFVGLLIPALVVWATPVVASGAWQTYLRPTVFSATLADADTVWCASRDGGLLQFTPSRGSFASFTREPNALASNQLSALAIDRSRRLWVGTSGAGASVLSANRASWSLVNAFDGLPSDSVSALAVDGDTVWIGTTAGLALWDGHQVSGVLPDGINPSPFANNSITGIVVRGDSLWVATRAGIYYSRLSQSLSTWTTMNAGLPTLAVDALVGDDVTLFALASAAAYRLDTASGQWMLVGGLGAVRALTVAHGSVFAGAGNGLYRWDGAAWTLLNSALATSDSSPMVLTRDAVGRVWAVGKPASSPDVSGTGVYGQPVGGGAGAWSFDFPPGPPHNNCLNLDVEGDRLYVSAFGQGLGRMRAGRWTYWYATPIGDTSSTRFFRPSFSFGMLIDKDGYKWFCCWAPYRPVGANCVPDIGAIEILDDSGGVDRVRHHLLGPTPDSARWSFGIASAVDSAGGRWFGLSSPCGDQPNLTPAGLLYFKSDTEGAVNYKRADNSAPDLASDLVMSLATDRNRRLWIGTGRGLCYIDNAGVAAPTVTTVPFTDSYDVHGLAVHGDAVWVYTSHALYQYGISANNNRGSYNIPGGPAGLAMRPLDVGLDGTVWLGTISGVRAYHPSGGFDDYTTANSPLADDEVRTVRVDRVTGQVWIATAGGLNRFDPSYVPTTVRLPSLSISVYPNPARQSAIGVPVRLTGNGSDYVGAIYDLSGRRLTRFSVRGNQRVVWDGRDSNRELARPGIYFLRAESGGRSSVVRLVLLR
jgi:ligand-binding sensor domain-containing protein